ncbi:MAG: type III-A CRISPR-associated RAMP protein Csm4 [Clostridiales bacterium]|nr:type III-A CRISPR-associated RAMP protein Csm4 [Clostridiales bacterium]
MNYKMVKMHFTTAVHFGDGGLETCKNTLCADTVFSALCVEAAQFSQDALERVISAVQTRHVCFSDAFPFIGDRIYLPKPLMYIEKIETEDETVNSSVLKKTAKKLLFIESDQFDDYIAGRADIIQMETYFSDNFGKYDLVSKNAKTIDDADAEPYSVRIFRYKEGNGLYFLLGYEMEDEYELIKEILTHLSLRGIGGKTSSGYGKFTYEIMDVPEMIIKRMKIESDKYMSLTTSIPDEDELEETMAEYAGFLLVRRSGYVASVNYSDSLKKRRTLYFAAAGAVFSKRFNGKIWNAQTGDGSHAVYKYAVPMFIGV